MIAICVAVHNQLEYTKRFFASIARHSYPYHLGFFVADNGSTDKTPEWLERDLKGNPKVVIRTNNESLSKSWNLILKAALDHDADILCLINNDVIVGAGWLAAIINQYVKSITDPTSKPAYWLPNGNFEEASFEQQSKDRQKTGRTTPGRCGWCLFFRAVTVREFLPIPEELKLWYGDDWIHWKLRNLGYECLVVDDCCAYHFGSKTLEIRKNLQPILDADRATYHRLTGEAL